MNEKNNFLFIFIIALFSICAIFYAGYKFSSNYTAANNAFRNEIKKARNNNKSIIDVNSEIESAISSCTKEVNTVQQFSSKILSNRKNDVQQIKNIKQGLTESTDTATDAENNLKKARQLIKECLGILQSIKETK